MNGGPVGTPSDYCLRKRCGCGVRKRNEVPDLRLRTAAYLPMSWDVRFRREGTDRSRPRTIFQSPRKFTARALHLRARKYRRNRQTFTETFTEWSHRLSFSLT